MALREIFAKFTIKFGTADLKKGSEAVTEAAANVRELGAVIAGGALVEGVRRFARDFSASASDVQRQAQRLGISTIHMQELGFAAGSAGKELEDMVDAMSTLQERARDAVLDPQSDPARQLRLLGVEAKDSQGNLKDAETLIGEVADGLMGMETQTDRVGATMTLFGDIGRDLLPVLQNGSAGLQAMRDRARELGGGLSEASIAAGAEFGSQVGELEFSLQGLRSTMALALLPALTRFVTFMTNATAVVLDFVEGTSVLKVAMVIIGGAAVAMGVKMLAGFAVPLGIMALVIIIVGLIILIVDDLITLFDGGKSVIGEFIDTLFGIGTAKQVVIDLKDAWEGLALAIGKAAEMLGLIDSFDDDIANTEQSQADMERRQVRTAALQGQVIRTSSDRQGGLTQDQARERANRIRMEQGMDTVLDENFEERRLTRSERRAQSGATRVPAANRRAAVRANTAAQVNQENTVNQGDTNISIEGVRDTQLTQTIEGVLRRQQGINLRDTMDALVQETEAEDG